MSELALPERFSDLSRFVATWALPTEKQRHQKRLNSTLDEVRAFYDAMFPRMDEVMGYLKGIPAANRQTLPAQDRTLFNLALAFMDASHPIALRWRRVDVDDGFPSDRVIYRTPSDSE